MDNHRPTLITIGSINMDLLVRLPRLPQPNDRIRPLEVVRAPGGMGGNVSTAFARLGGHVRFTGAFAGDAEGRLLRADLACQGVDVSFASDLAMPETPCGLILVGEDGARAIIASWQELREAPHRLRGDDPPVPAAGDAYVARWLRRFAQPWQPPAGLFAPPVDGFYCPGNFAPWVLPALPPDLRLFVDIEQHHTTHMSQATLIEVLQRAAIVFGNERSLELAARQLECAGPADLVRVTPALLVVTLGAEGCCVVRAGQADHVPGFRVTAVDTTGAGDCFAAAFIWSILRGHAPLEAARYANAAAALSTRALGARTAAPTHEEVEALLRA